MYDQPTRDLESRLGAWLTARAPADVPPELRRRVAGIPAAAGTHAGSFAGVRRPGARSTRILLLVAVTGGLLAATIGGTLITGSGPWRVTRSTTSTEPSPTATAAPTSTAPAIVRQAYDGLALGWSSDGTRLLIQKDDGNLFVRHVDGSETPVTEQLSAFRYLRGSARPSGATISPDGSRVVYAGLTEGWEGHSCHFGALFAVDADGGPAEVLWRSHVPQNGIVRYPTFSPDGTQIAFVDDYCDNSHNVWVMNADGTGAHKIVSNPLGTGHVLGLKWSAAGDRIALSSSLGYQTFAPDGSDFRGPTPIP